MYFLDAARGMDGSRVFKVQNNFDYPLAKDKSGNYKIKSGERIRMCMTSDFFLPQADEWRGDAWRVIKQRPDVVFFLLTKRPERVADCLPADWGDGRENVFFNVTCENQARGRTDTGFVQPAVQAQRGYGRAVHRGGFDRAVSARGTDQTGVGGR